MIKAHRYSGNKARHLKHLQAPTKIYDKIIEPYAGSMIYSLNSSHPAIGVDINADLCDMWAWLKSISPADLIQLDKDLKAYFNGKSGDLRTFVKSIYPNSHPGLLTYCRVNTAGIYTGQLSGYKYYEQHNLPIKDTIAALPRLKNISIIHSDERSVPIDSKALYFIDPPYFNTNGNYISKSAKSNLTKQYSPIDTMNLINQIDAVGAMMIFTYGDGANVMFPNLPWQKLFDKKVPNIRKGGTVDRTEWVCYLNF